MMWPAFPQASAVEGAVGHAVEVEEHTDAVEHEDVPETPPDVRFVTKGGFRRPRLLPARPRFSGWRGCNDQAGLGDPLPHFSERGEGNRFLPLVGASRTKTGPCPATISRNRERSAARFRSSRASTLQSPVTRSFSSGTPRSARKIPVCGGRTSNREKRS